MCLLFVAVRHFEKSPLVIAFNRDETIERPAHAAHFWEDCPTILAGRDVARGGTWGGITRSGRMAFITFVRRQEPWMESPIPRGEIVPDFLKSTQSPEEFIATLRRAKALYLGYNVVCGSVDDLWYYSNVTDHATKLEPGIHGIANAFLNTPWPKVVRGIQSLKKLSREDSVERSTIFEILTDEQRAELSELPTDTGLREEKEWQRSSIFVNAPGHATRCSTAVVVHNDGRVEFCEKSFHPFKGEVSYIL